MYISDATSIEDVKKEVLDMGKLTNHLEQAKAVVFDMDTRLNKIETLIKKNSSSKELPKVYWEIWNEPMMSVGKNSFINDIIKKAGGQNIFEQEETSYPIVSAEAVIFARPDYIFYTTENSEKTAFWNMDNALQNCKVIFMGEDERFVRSCPRCVEAVEILADILWQVR